MNVGHQNTAKHIRSVFFGGNWTCSNFKNQLADISWEQAIEKHEGFNTITMLTYHIGYFISAQLQVMQGGPLDAHDKFSYKHPTINSKADWDEMIEKILNEAEELATLIEQMPDKKMEDAFANSKYGSNYFNFHGMIEHSHYHLGQIVILKKLIKK